MLAYDVRDEKYFGSVFLHIATVQNATNTNSLGTEDMTISFCFECHCGQTFLTPLVDRFRG